MAMNWIDVSIPLSEKTTVWPGDPQFEFAPLSRVARGDSCNTSQLKMGTHTGTHIDAPWHFEDNGTRLDHIDTSLFFGEATIIDLQGVSVLTAKNLGESALPGRVLLKTRNSHIPVDGPFHKEFVALSADGARRLVDEGVRLVGIDYLSVGAFNSGAETHHILLGNGIVCVEGLRLRGVPAGVCQFVVLPLPLVGADGAPCRAFVGMEVADREVADREVPG